jgi:hypothetical protein
MVISDLEPIHDIWLSSNVEIKSPNLYRSGLFNIYFELNAKCLFDLVNIV